MRINMSTPRDPAAAYPPPAPNSAQKMEKIPQCNATLPTSGLPRIDASYIMNV